MIGEKRGNSTYQRSRPRKKTTKGESGQIVRLEGAKWVVRDDHGEGLRESNHPHSHSCGERKGARTKNFDLGKTQKLITKLRGVLHIQALKKIKAARAGTGGRIFKRVRKEHCEMDIRFEVWSYQ